MRSRVVDYAERNHDRKQHVHKAVNLLGYVDSAKLLKAEHEQRGYGRLQCPAFNARLLRLILFHMHTPSDFRIAQYVLCKILPNILSSLLLKLHEHLSAFVIRKEKVRRNGAVIRSYFLDEYKIRML